MITSFIYLANDGYLFSLLFNVTSVKKIKRKHQRYHFSTSKSEPRQIDFIN